MRRHFASAVSMAAASIASLSAGPALADTMTFSRGSLIIPMQSTFQTKCGQVSAYGLIYRILQANGPGHLNAANPVTVYLVVDEGKQSPNRCKPTNNASYNSSVPSQSSSNWNDGCDLSISNNTEQPVVKVTYGTAFPTAGATYADGDLSTYDDSAAWPRYATFSSGKTTASPPAPSPIPSSRFTTVNYLGGPFVIDASSAQAVMNLLNNGDSGTKAFPAVATSTFRTPCTCSGLSASTTTSSGYTVSGGCHYVDIHQATTSFTANVSRRINQVPPPFALYDPDYVYSSSSNSVVQGSDGRRQQGSPQYVLDRYIQISGLWLEGTSNHQDSRGCPVGSVSACKFNGSSGAAHGTEASAAQANEGTVFDLYTTEDIDHVSSSYPNGLLNRQGAGGNVYQLFWAPHWDVYSDTKGNDANGLSSIKTFYLNHGNILGECASIVGWENGGSPAFGSYSRTTSPGGVSAGTNFLFTNGVRYAFLWGSEYGSDNNSISATTDSGFSGKNCSDPNASTTCVNFRNPGNLFSQIGDWTYSRQLGTDEGHIPDPTTSSARQPWNKQMVDTSDGFDVFNMGQKSGSTGVVVYVGGHDVSGDPMGARIVLNSMLNLSMSLSTSERGLAAPTIAYGTTQARTFNDELLTPTYDAVTGYSTNPAVKTFDPSSVNNLKLWVWPYYPGHLRAHPMSSLSAGDQAYASALTYDVAGLSTSPSGMLPAPSTRNLFTWLGGYPKLNPTLSGLGTAPHNVLQIGWTPETIDGTKLDVSLSCPPSPAHCVDVLGVRDPNNSMSWTGSVVYDDHENNLHLVRGSDGLCDLQEMTNFSGLNSGINWGSSGNCSASNISKYLNDAAGTAWIFQRVRGYCYTENNTNYTPSDSQCPTDSDLQNRLDLGNRAHLGGLVHSSPAVLTPSSYVADGGAPRPVVSFAGGYDGQLHAFYVGGGQGYTGPATTLHFAEDNSPVSKFNTNWSTTFTSTTPAAGTELWSFLPVSQLPHLQDNSAQVDSSPQLMDVFADFGGTGIREWHTVLMVSLGRMGTELFAIDVTNPLEPRLLWDIVGSVFRSGSTPWYSPNILLTDALGSPSPLPGTLDEPKWNADTALFLPYPETDTGRTMTKVYDYQDLGGSAGLTTSQVRMGLEPVYVVYAASNMPPGRKGIEVFAIEAATGQKLWQWEHAYTSSTVPSDNAVPPPVAVINGLDGASRVLVGDQEGRVWELDAITGANVNMSTTLTGCSASAPCRFPAFDARSTSSVPQPITTNVAVAVVPSTVASGHLLYSYRGQRVVIFGTAGADWISGAASVPGKLHVALYDDSAIGTSGSIPLRVPIRTGAGKELDGTTDWTPTTALNAASTYGVLQEVPGFPDVFSAGERLYGDITVTGGAVYYSTASSQVSDIMQLSASASGHTYALDLFTAATGALHSTLLNDANYGGVAVYSPTNATTGVRSFQGIVGDQVAAIGFIPQSSAGTQLTNDSGPSSQLRPDSNSGITYRLMSWFKRFLDLP